MDAKTKLTSKFNKENFQILGDIDEYIKDFMLALNKNEHIITKFSCEGHSNNDSAYLYFNVDEIGWDLFFTHIVPEISYNLTAETKPIVGADDFVFNNGESVPAYFTIKWEIGMLDNKWGSGINIHCKLSDIEIDDKVVVSWKKIKSIFWETTEEAFMKHFNI